ncbi:MAG: hypothetical protein M1602_04770 [Firmicutes bacterium]|nr:hypothetical protein [Bacillota bacterium]
MIYENVVSLLLLKVPEFRAAYEELTSWAGKDVGQHVVFGALFEFTVGQGRIVTSHDDTGAEAEGVVSKVLRFIEEAAASNDEHVRNLIQVSFMEHLQPTVSVHEYIRERLGPQSSKLLKAAESW